MTAVTDPAAGCGDFDCVDASNYEPGCPVHDPYPDGYPDPGPSFWIGNGRGNEGTWGCEQCPASGKAETQQAAAREALRHEKEMHP